MQDQLEFSHRKERVAAAACAGGHSASAVASERSGGGLEGGRGASARMQLQQPWQRDRRTEQYVAKQLAGSRVILCDLRRREDLNGAEGKLLGFHEESDRWMVEVKEGGEQLRLKFANLRFIKEEGEEGPEDSAAPHGAPAVHSFHPPPTSMERLTDEEREAIERMTAVIQQTKWEPSEEVKREVQAIKPKPKEAEKVFVARALQQKPSYAGIAVALLFVVSSVLMAYVFATGYLVGTSR